MLGMIIEWDRGAIVNRTPGGDPSDPDWWPDDTRTAQRRATGALVVAPFQPASDSEATQADWERRAARQWNKRTKQWEPTGAAREESVHEKALRLLKTKVPQAPADLPENPDRAAIVAQVRALTDQVRVHRRYTEAYRRLWRRLAKKFPELRGE